MDLFSHVFLGFVLGQALQLDRNVQIILIVSSVILDIDAISIRGWEASFQFHRGPLHSILGAILVSLLIGTVYTVFMRLPATVFTSVVSICLGGLFGHIFLDMLTSGSMKVLWPFSNEKFALNLAHYVDPIFFCVLLLASILIACMKNNTSMIQTVAIVAIALLAVNFGVRYYERDAATKTIKELNVGIGSEMVSLPTIRPDRWWVVAKTPFENGYRYEMYSVDSIRNKILSKRTVESPYIDYRGPTEPPIDSPQKAVGYSKRDNKVSAFIEKLCLPAVNVALSDDGNTWQVFWYDAFIQMSRGEFRGIVVKVGFDGMLRYESSGIFGREFRQMHISLSV